MGVDILLYAEVEVSPERLDVAEAAFKATVAVADDYPPHWRPLAIDDASWLPRPRVVANLTQRYYGPGYERGHWPWIYVAIEALRHLFPEAKVYYGGDSSDEGEEVTDEFLIDIWRHYLGPDGDAYRRFMRERFPAPAAPDSEDRQAGRALRGPGSGSESTGEVQ